MAAINFHMPEDIIENILTFLPIREPCRLSILSKRFRHCWKRCRDLSFDRDFAENLSIDRYRRTVNRILRLHLNTPVDTFKLYYDASSYNSLVSYWIHRAANLGLKELELDFTPSPIQYTLSYDLFDVASLRVMKFVNCGLHLPLNSNGHLRYLREITFQNVRQPVTIEALFNNCVYLTTVKFVECTIYSIKVSAQRLQTLVVKDCSNVHSIAIINAPLLRKFHYRGKITKFEFVCELPCLSDMKLEIAPP